MVPCDNIAISMRLEMNANAPMPSNDRPCTLRRANATQIMADSSASPRLLLLPSLLPLLCMLDLVGAKPALMLERRAAAEATLERRLVLGFAPGLAPAGLPSGPLPPPLAPPPGRGEPTGDGDGEANDEAAASSASCMLKASRRSMSGRPVLAVCARSLSAAAVVAAFWSVSCGETCMDNKQARAAGRVTIQQNKYQNNKNKEKEHMRIGQKNRSNFSAVPT